MRKENAMQSLDEVKAYCWDVGTRIEKAMTTGLIKQVRPLLSRRGDPWLKRANSLPR